jgi:hypothetical protein
VRETVTAFQRRTGEAYAPTPLLRMLGTPLGPREACPTLFRFPGPEGLRDFFQASLRLLAPAERAHAWLTGRPTGAYPRVVEAFGTLAVLQPLRLSPCRTHCFQHTRDNWVGLNRARPDLDLLVWVPTGRVRASVPWDRLRTAAQARRVLGPGYDEQARLCEDRLHAYLEELSDLRRAGAPGPSRHWCEEKARDRRALLRRYGLRPRWTRP